MLIEPRLKNSDFIENHKVAFKITMFLWKILNLREATEDIGCIVRKLVQSYKQEAIVI